MAAEISIGIMISWVIRFALIQAPYEQSDLILESVVAIHPPERRIWLIFSKLLATEIAFEVGNAPPVIYDVSLFPAQSDLVADGCIDRPHRVVRPIRSTWPIYIMHDTKIGLEMP